MWRTMKWSVDTTSELTDVLANEWAELASRASASPFMYPGWINAWWRAFGSGSLAILVLRRGGSLAGVLPLMRRRGALMSTTNWHTPEYSPFAEDDDALTELIRAAFARTSIRLDLSFVDDDSPAIEACSRIARVAGFDPLVRTVHLSPYLEIQGDWSTYEAGLPARKTAKYRRFRKRLEERGQVSIEVADGSDRLAELLRQGFDVEALGYEHRPSRGVAILANRETTQFYLEVAAWAAARGWLRLWMLRLDETPIAFAYGLEHDGAYFDLKLGFDPQYARFGPGVLLMRERIRHAFASSLARFEFLGAAERHKLDWTSTVRDLRRVQEFAPTAAGAANRIAWTHGRPIAKRLIRGG